ncbi:MAG TPA: hypothetical protein VLH94_04840 [Spirochaetia bacterium]|nr:hypothetical protein [Spirochaetia bacterium]
MKKISGLIMVVMMVMFSPMVLAKSESDGTGAGTGTGTGAVAPKITVSPTSGAGVANQNQVKTQNAGEESQLMVSTAEKEEAGDSTISATMRSEMAQEKMSEVAKGVEDILNAKTLKGGIGDQVKQLAQEQKESQDQVRDQINKIDSRGGFVKALIGTDYKALKNLESQLAQNVLRIEQLVEFKNQLTNTGDIAMVQETINALIEQNVSLQDKISAEDRLGSVFGWLVKLFVK